MNSPNLSRQPYRRPPLVRATDPQRMNWLWRLVCEVAEIPPAEVVEALHALQVPVDQQRARSWTVSDRDDSFFPMSIAEVERNLRALVEFRAARREEGEAPVDELAAIAAIEDAELDFDDDGLDAADVDVADAVAPEAELSEEDELVPGPERQAESEA